MAHSSPRTAKAAPGARCNAATNAGLIEIQIQYRATGDLVLDPRNPRQHSQSQVNRIADSIREFGFVMPIVVDHTGQVVVGHGRVLAARKLGMLRVSESGSHTVIYRNHRVENPDIIETG